MLQSIELTARDPELKRAVERRHFLFTGHAHHNISDEQLENEMPELERIIERKTLAVLRQCDEYIKKETTKIKQDVPIDGDMKRAVANLLIKILKDVFIDDEVKGIMRQGYKIMRGK